MKGSPFEIAAEILRYYATTRRIGHTTTMIEGVRHDKLAQMRGVKPHIVVHDMKYARQLADSIARDSFAARQDPRGALTLTADQFITLDSIDLLRGVHAPLVFDHHAIAVLLDGMCAADSRTGTEVRETATRVVHEAQEKISELLTLAETWKERALAAEQRLKDCDCGIGDPRMNKRGKGG